MCRGGKAGRDVRVARSDGQEVGSGWLAGLSWAGRKKRVLVGGLGGCAWC